MIITDRFILKFVHVLKERIADREKDCARAAISDLYAHARLQGGLDGLDEALIVLNDLLEDVENDHSRD